ncbi:hypothetical protein SLA2020_023200 [Shorea laevis]
MGGRGRKNKVVPSKSGVSKRAVGSKSDTDVRKNGIEESEKKQGEGVKLGASGLAPIGFDVEEMEKSQLTTSDFGVGIGSPTKSDGVKPQTIAIISHGPVGKCAEKGSHGSVEQASEQRSEDKGKQAVMSEAHGGKGQSQFGSEIASASGTKTIEFSKARWGDMLQEVEEGILPMQKPKPMRSWSSVVQGNRDIRKGWELQYVKPQDPSGAVVITEEEWNEGSKIWQNALVGYVLGIKPSFKDMANFVNNRWKEFQVPKAFILRNGVFLFDFADNDAKQAVLEKRWTFNDHPLILKQWTPDFDPDNLDVSKIPVWIQFPDLHLSLWKPESLSKIASYLGVPIATDALTAKRQRVSFARMLVEVEVMEQLPRVVPVVGPKGIFQQPVVFEWAPVRCGKCNNLGHEDMNCRAKTRKIWVVKQSISESEQHKVLVPDVGITASEVKAQVVDTTSDQLLKLNSEATLLQLEKTDYHCGTVVAVQNCEKIDLVENATGSKGEMQNAGGGTGTSSPVT